MSRTALITGGARGIGYGIAVAMAKESINPVIMDLHPEEDVADALSELGSYGVRPLYCNGDVTCPQDRAAVLDEIKVEFGRLHILVNNAGVAPRVRADLLDASEESFERLMLINLQGPYFLTQAVARWMIEQEESSDESFDGCIMNISSISATVASPSRGDYCISKAGVSMATRLWAARLSEYNIPVYEIRPGIIRTDMTAAVTDKYDKLISEGLCLQRRWGLPEDVGRAAMMLAHGDLAYSTGQVLLVDGGMTVQTL